ncbi:mitochondrial genome maintenance exonuclease 1 [Pimephales promelas]|uniref:mitochondrial genome maintenance exonuclease 1 n=1 Tax=Pimephales promelas TaxID=90988 RepID=UPI0019554A86|nr:mitochondrial genome maintenance exonuclease 1 [Pimephales promelas]KAG1935939.1 mitochondrial genome maintenance exonuclease [Pimephales promelas]
MAITMQVLKVLIQCKCARSMGLPSGQFSRVDHFSTSCQWRARKKVSQYSTVDTERYKSLVRAVLTSKTSSQTPVSIEDEDCQLYGPVIRSRPPSQQPKVPKNLHPLLNEAKGQSEYVPGPLARIPLQRDSNTTSPSVTRILQKTMPPDQAFYLERWKRMMIAELGEEGFKEYSLKIFRQGQLFHSAIEDHFTPETPSKEDPDRPLEVSGFLESASHVLNDITGVRAIESAVHHSTLQYLGIVDCVAQYRGSLCVIDWKTSEKPKPLLHHTYDNPLQVAAYIGALNSDNNYSYQVKNGLIVVAYKDGSPAHAHFLNSKQIRPFWEKWLLRLEEYAEK